MSKKHVTFEQAVKLKEKGFDVDCTHAYCQSIKLDHPIGDCFPKDRQFKPNVKEEWDAPEQHEVVDWLLEKHDIWIQPERISKDEYQCFYIGYNTCKIQINGLFKTPKEAYSAAFDYVLNKLI